MPAPTPCPGAGGPCAALPAVWYVYRCNGLHARARPTPHAVGAVFPACCVVRVQLACPVRGACCPACCAASVVRPMRYACPAAHVMDRPSCAPHAYTCTPHAVQLRPCPLHAPCLPRCAPLCTPWGVGFLRTRPPADVTDCTARPRMPLHTARTATPRAGAATLPRCARGAGNPAHGACSTNVLVYARA